MAGVVLKKSVTDTISVPEMQCGSCEAIISKALKKIDGVDTVMADAEANIVVVRYNPQLTTRKALVSAVAAAGYTAEDKAADKKAQSNLPMCCRPGGGH
jgi:copper chaperone CopZ